ncbi:MAG: Flp pilus assembly complex ATPase component TadA [Myxococcales bacterium]|nr:Flp pilus assembly complex ATPase component TadA [Myxococcales bacterium]
MVTDNSANGTWIGTRRIHNEEARIRSGSMLRLGPYRVTIRAHDEGADFQTDSVVSGSFTVGKSHPPSQSAVSPTVSPDGGKQGALAPDLRRRIHRLLLEHMDLAAYDRNKMNDQQMRPKVHAALSRIMGQMSSELAAGINPALLIEELADEALGLGPLERLLADDTVSEIMVVDSQTIFVERRGKIERATQHFTDEEAVRAVIERIVTPLGRRIDESNPLVDARLKDGSRVNAIIRPLALKGASITIRKFSRSLFSVDQLVELDTLSLQMAQFLVRSVKAKKNIVISGGTGSGKTTLLNVLSSSIPAEERIVTIEDAAELQLPQVHVVPLEARPPNMEGKGEFAIRDLVRNALRMRPDRIVVGECRGGEALDMLQAMNTGHDGSLTTIHANSPLEAVNRLETLVLMSGLDLPIRAIREQIARSIHLVVQQARLADGTRRITRISEVVGISHAGELKLHDIFEFVRTGTGPKGHVLGEFVTTGYLPTFLEEFGVLGLVEGADYL